MTLSTMFATFRQQQDSRHHMYSLPAERIYPEVDTKPIEAGSAYCRLWLREMQLSRSGGWFHSYYPVVHATTGFTYGKDIITTPCLTEPSLLSEMTKSNLDQVIRCDYPLTPLFPFIGGDIEIQAGLLSVVANNPIQRFATSVGRIAELIPIPEFSTALKLASTVYDAIENLIGAGEGKLVLGYEGRFVSAGSGAVNELRSGYFATILDEQGGLDIHELCVLNGHLKRGPKGNEGEFRGTVSNLKQCSYMLFELEKRSSQDMDNLHGIAQIVSEAEEARLQGSPKRAIGIFQFSLIPAVYQSFDILPIQREPFLRKVYDRLNKIGLQSNQSTSPISLKEVMRQREAPMMDTETEAVLAEWMNFFKEIEAKSK